MAIAPADSTVTASPEQSAGKRPAVEICDGWTQAWLVGGLVLIGATLRLAYLGEVSLWFDESFCWKMSTYPWSEQWSRAAGDNHPPLYYFVLKAWTTGLGHSPWAARLLSVVCGLFAIVGTYFLVREMEASALSLGKNDWRAVLPATLAAALVAFSPFQMEWSQTVRMYALGVPLTVWSSWALLVALRQTATWRAWVGYALLIAALIYTHYFGLFILAAHGVYGLSVCGWRARMYGSWREWLPALSGPVLAAAIVGVLWWPWMDEFLAQRRRGIEQEWGRPAGLEHFLKSIAEMFGLMWHPATTHDLTLPWLIALALLLVSVATVLFGRGSERLLGLCVLSTFGLAVLIASGGKSLVASWYFLFAHALALCAVAIWLGRCPPGWMRQSAILIVMVAAVWQGWEQVQWRQARTQSPSFQGAMAYVESLRQAHEPVFVNGPRDWVAVSPYVEIPDSSFVLSPRTDFRFGEGTAVLSPADYATNETLAERSARRAWGVFATNGSRQPVGVELSDQWIDVAEERFHDWHYGQIVVQEFVMHSAEDSLKDVEPELSATP